MPQFKNKFKAPSSLNAQNASSANQEEETKVQERKISDISNQSEDLYLPRFGMRIDIREPLTPTSAEVEMHSPLAFKRVEFAHNS